MAAESSDHEVGIVDVELKVGNRRLNASIPVSTAPMRFSGVLPIVQQVADAIVGSAVEEAESRGRHVTCAAGCGACCRQLVPLSEVEARQIRDLVAAMPEPRRSQVTARFEAAREILNRSELSAELANRYAWSEEHFVKIVRQYFGLGIACPFLEDESCSIHPDRPISCREYLVTSPAEYCAGISRQNIVKVDMPVRVSTALTHLAGREGGSKYVRWVPLILALDWADEHPDESEPRPGTELLAELFEQLGCRPTDAPTGPGEIN